jgi:hypothetical protein
MPEPEIPGKAVEVVSGRAFIKPHVAERALRDAIPIIHEQRDKEWQRELQFEIDVLRSYQQEKGGMLGKLAEEIANALTERCDSIFEEVDHA